MPVRVSDARRVERACYPPGVAVAFDSAAFARLPFAAAL